MASRRAPLLLLHLPVFLWYLFALHKEMLLTSGSRHFGTDTYGGRWKYLTFINMVLQTTFFGVCVLTDLVWHLSWSDKRMQQLSLRMSALQGWLFSALAFPIGFFVVVSFWILYAYDRELVYPEIFDTIIPTWLNHAMHTVVLLLLMLELIVVQHHWPSHKGCLTVLITFCSSYLVWLLWIRHRSAIWVYPILEVLSPFGLGMFLTAAVLVTISLYVVGEKLHYWRWGLPDQCGKESCYFDRDQAQECRLNSASVAASEKCSNPDILDSASPSTTATVSQSFGTLAPFSDPFQQKLLDLHKDGFEHLAGKLDQMIDLMGTIAQSLSALALIQSEPAVPVIRCPSPATVSHRAKPSTPEQSESATDPPGEPELDTNTQKEIDNPKPIRLPLKSQLPSLRRTAKSISSASSGVHTASSVELRQAEQGSPSLIPDL